MSENLTPSEVEKIWNEAYLNREDAMARDVMRLCIAYARATSKTAHYAEEGVSPDTYTPDEWQSTLNKMRGER